MTEYARAECFACGATTVLHPDNIARLCGECGLPIKVSQHAPVVDGPRC